MDESSVTSQPLPTTRFSTADLPAADRFDVWRQSIAVVFDVEPLADAPRDDFNSSVTGFHLGDLLVGTVEADAQRYLRAPRGGQVDHYLVQSYLSGGYQADVGAGSISVDPGQISIIDLARPLDSVASAAHIVNLVIPRNLMDEVLPVGTDLHGLVLADGRGSFLADYLASLMRNLPALTLADAPRVSRVTRDMIAACLAPTAAAQERARQQIDGVLLKRARTYIEQRLTSADLTPANMCRALGMSRSSLYRLFEPLGGVAHYVQRRRLDQINRLLADPSEHRQVAEIAACYGFADGAHLARAFKRQFGMSPKEAREMAQQAHLLALPRSSDEPGRLHFDDWIKHLGT